MSTKVCKGMKKGNEDEEENEDKAGNGTKETKTVMTKGKIG